MENHILLQEKILKTFSIARIVSNENMDKIYEDMKKQGKSDKAIEKEMEKIIRKQADLNSIKHEIPGIILMNANSPKMPEIDKKKLEKINTFAMELSTLIMDEKLSLDDTANLFMEMVRILGLNFDDLEELNDEQDYEEGDDDDPEFEDDGFN